VALMELPGPWFVPHRKKPDKPYPYDWWYRSVYKPALAQVGLPARFNFHSLRHTSATNFIKQGGHSLALQAAAGWSDGKMPQRYVHLFSDDIKAVLNRMDRKSRNGTGP
jgi:integrase